MLLTANPIKNGTGTVAGPILIQSILDGRAINDLSYFSVTFLSMTWSSVFMRK